MPFKFRARRQKNGDLHCYEGDMQVPFLKLRYTTEERWLVLAGYHENEYDSRQFAETLVNLVGERPSQDALLAAVRLIRIWQVEEQEKEAAAEQAIERAYGLWLDNGGEHAAAIQAEDEIEREREANDPWLQWLRSGRDDAATAH